MRRCDADDVIFFVQSLLSMLDYRYLYCDLTVRPLVPVQYYLSFTCVDQTLRSEIRVK